MGIIQSFVSSVRMEYALEIMGRNSFSIADVRKAFGIDPSEPQLTTLSNVPYTENTLKECKDTHVLVAVFPFSIVNMRELVLRETADMVFSPKFWYKSEPFALSLGETIWQLIRKAPVPQSYLKTLDEHENIFMSKDDIMPKARVLVYTIVGFYLAKGERMFENVYARCSDRDSFGVRLAVSGIGTDGIKVTNEFGNRRHRDLCLVPVRKHDSH